MPQLHSCQWLSPSLLHESAKLHLCTVFVPRNAFSPTLTSAGISGFWREVQPENASSPMLSRPLGS